MKKINRTRLKTVLAQEQGRFVVEHPRSKDLFEQARSSLFCGVPMSWMTEWAGAFPVFVEEASGAHFVDAGENEALSVMFPTIQKALSLNVGHLGAILSVRQIIGLICRPLWGIVADRTTRKAVLMWGTGLRMA